MIKKISHIIVMAFVMQALPMHSDIRPNTPIAIPAPVQVPNNNNGNNQPFDGEAIFRSVVGAAFLASIVSFSYRIYQDPDEYEFESLESSQHLAEKLSILSRNFLRICWGPTMQPPIRELKYPNPPSRGVYGYLHDLFPKTPDAQTSSDTKSEA